jgi:hypothetical protein
VGHFTDGAKNTLKVYVVKLANRLCCACFSFIYNILCLLVGKECLVWKVLFSWRLKKFHCTMSFFRKNANLVVEVGVDDEEHDDEFKRF